MKSQLKDEMERYKKLCEELAAIYEEVLQRITKKYPTKKYPTMDKNTDRSNYFHKLSTLFYQYPADEVAVYIGKELVTHYTMEECLAGNLGIRDAYMYIAEYYKEQGEDRSAAQFTLLAFLEKFNYEHSNFSLVAASEHAYKMRRYVNGYYKRCMFYDLAAQCIDGIPDFQKYQKKLKFRRAFDMILEEGIIDQVKFEFLKLEHDLDMEHAGDDLKFYYYIMQYLFHEIDESILTKRISEKNEQLTKIIAMYQNERKDMETFDNYDSLLIVEHNVNKPALQLLEQIHH